MESIEELEEVTLVQTTRIGTLASWPVCQTLKLNPPKNWEEKKKKYLAFYAPHVWFHKTLFYESQ